jgi:hypothetical protein
MLSFRLFRYVYTFIINNSSAGMFGGEDCMVALSCSGRFAIKESCGESVPQHQGYS